MSINSHAIQILFYENFHQSGLAFCAATTLPPFWSQSVTTFLLFKQKPTKFDIWAYIANPYKSYFMKISIKVVWRFVLPQHSPPFLTQSVTTFLFLNISPPNWIFVHIRPIPTNLILQKIPSKKFMKCWNLPILAKYASETNFFIFNE